MRDQPLPTFDVRADFWSLRFVEERSEAYSVRKNVPMPFSASTDRGAMATVYADGGYGYAATADTSPAGLAAALERAAHWARVTARTALFDSRSLPSPAPKGRYRSPGFEDRMPSRREWLDLLHAESEAAGCDPRIVDWEAGIEVRTAIHRLVTSAGGDVVQEYRYMMPGLSVTAHDDGVTQTRSLNGYRGICQQGGVEVLARFGFADAGSNLVGIPLRNRSSDGSRSIPMMPSCGPVIPASVMYAVPFGRIRSSAVCTCVCVPTTSVTLPSRCHPMAIFSLVASA